MPVPADFHFSQGNLQDFVDCRRRFELRYLKRIAWPAVAAEPIGENERHAQQGALFHLMVQQYLVGVPAERLTATAQEVPLLAGWWQAFLDFAQSAALAGQHHPEITLSAPLDEMSPANQRRLVAQFDLVVVTPERRAVIFDWKTSLRRPARQWLAQRLQTRVYPHLLAQAGADLNAGQPFQPGQIEMVYWFAGFPDRPERFVYSAEQYAEDAAYLARLVEQVAALSLGDEPFPLTTDEERCRFCVYRSLCDRGRVAGRRQEDEVDLDFAEPDEAFAVIEVSLDFEQVAEIEY